MEFWFYGNIQWIYNLDVEVHYSGEMITRRDLERR